MSFVKSLKSPSTRRRIYRVILFALVGSYLAFLVHFSICQEGYFLEAEKDPTDMKPSTYAGQETPFTLPKTMGDDGEIHYRRYMTTIMPIKGKKPGICNLMEAIKANNEPSTSQKTLLAYQKSTTSRHERSMSARTPTSIMSKSV